MNEDLYDDALELNDMGRSLRKAFDEIILSWGKTYKGFSKKQLALLMIESIEKNILNYEDPR